MTTPYTGNNAGPIVVSFTLPSDGDDVDATSVNVAFQPNADNWQYAKRVFPDLLTGGTWTFTSSLTLSNIFVFNGDVSLLGAANNVANGAALDIGLMVLGSPSVGTLQFNGNTASFITGAAATNGFDLTSVATDGVGISSAGNGNGAGVLGVGGATGIGGIFTGGGSGAGVVGTGGANGIGVAGVGNGTGPGLVGTPGGSNHYGVISNGAIQINVPLATSSTAPGSGAMWANQIVKCAGNVTTSGTTANATVNGGFNIASAFCANLSGGSYKSLRIQMAQAMSGADYIVTVSLPGNTSGWTPYVNVVDASNFDLSFYAGSSGPQPVDNVALQFFFIVVG